MIEITREPLSAAKLMELAFDEECGATVSFFGCTRRWTDGVETAFLEYEAYADMALQQMELLAAEARERWSIRKLIIVHRIGRVEVREPSVAVIVSTPHRREAFDAGEWLIDELKKRVPIWKKEWFSVSAPKWIHPVSKS